MAIAPTTAPARRSAGPPRATRRAHTTARVGARDPGVDLVRAGCVCVVVLLHALMVGVTVDASGPVFENAADGAAWFAPVTWAAQVMPLFFVIGGFAGAIAYRRLRQRGGTAAGFVVGRVHRLLLPAVLSIGAVGLGLVTLTAWGVPAELVQIAGYRYSQPLWFLGVFLMCQALLPVLLAAHERAPLQSIAGLVAAAVVVDVARAVTGLDAIGFLNLVFIWCALQQVGFHLADGRLEAVRLRSRVLTGAGAGVLLVGLCMAGIYSPDLYENLNPPTVALLLVGVAQTCLLSLFRGPLARLSQRPPVAAFTDFVAVRSMTIYLWHMPVLLALAGAAALLAMETGLELPEPSSVEWWLSRPLWLGLGLALTAGVAWALAGGERSRLPEAPASVRHTVQAVLAGLAGVVLLLVAGTTVVTAVISVALLLFALARVWVRTGAHRAERHSVTAEPRQ